MLMLRSHLQDGVVAFYYVRTIALIVFCAFTVVKFLLKRKEKRRKMEDKCTQINTNGFAKPILFTLCLYILFACPICKKYINTAN